MNIYFLLSLINFIALAFLSPVLSQATLPLCLWGQDCTGQTCVKGTSCMAVNLGFPKVGTCLENLIPAARLIAGCTNTMDAGCLTNADCCNPAATCQAATPCTSLSSPKATCVTGKTCQLPACRNRV